MRKEAFLEEPFVGLACAPFLYCCPYAAADCRYVRCGSPLLAPQDGWHGFTECGPSPSGSYCGVVSHRGFVGFPCAKGQLPQHRPEY